MTYIERASQSGKPKIVKKPAVRPASLGGRLADTKGVRLVFFGTEDFSAASLQKLIADNWDVIAIITKPDFKTGRGQKVTVPSVKKIAEKQKITIFQPRTLSEITNNIKTLKPDFGILSAYGKIISQDFIELFPGGIINVHPSLLPKYRGASPIESTILSGGPKTGISLIKLTAGMDEGPVYAQKSIRLSGRETRPALYKKLASIGAEFLVEKLSRIIDGSLQLQAQDKSIATYAPLLKKADGYMDWSKPAELLEREVRAFLGYPKSTAKIADSKVIITKARVAKDKKDGGLVVQCQPGYLEIVELVAPSGRTMNGKDFLRGYKK